MNNIKGTYEFHTVYRWVKSTPEPHRPQDIRRKTAAGKVTDSI